MNLLMHTETRKQISSFLNEPSHAVLISGPIGAGKKSLAVYLAASLLNIEEDRLASTAFYMHLEPTEEVITIESIRTLQKFTQLKTIGTGQIRRVIIIEDASRMTTEAQNALLKVLEEPPKDTVIILTASPERRLLSTIYSRLQKLNVKPIEKDDVSAHLLNEGYESKDIDKAYYIAEGHIGLMKALLANDETHPLINSIETAKKIVSLGQFERITYVDMLSKQKDQLPEFLYALRRVYKAVLVRASETGNDKQTTRSYNALRLILDAEAALKSNPNPKLLLSDLFLNI